MKIKVNLNKRGVFIAFLFLLFWAFVAGNLTASRSFFNQGQENKWETVEHPDYNFSITYPAIWRDRKHSNTGFKGDRDVRLFVYESSTSLFRIKVLHRPQLAPTLKDVVAFGQARIIDIENDLLSQGKSGYVELGIWEDQLNGHPVIRHEFLLGSLKFQYVYIARAEDMIILVLQTYPEDYENKLADFQAIVESFHPLE